MKQLMFTTVEQILSDSRMMEDPYDPLSMIPKPVVKLFVGLNALRLSRFDKNLRSQDWRSQDFVYMHYGTGSQLAVNVSQVFDWTWEYDEESHMHVSCVDDYDRTMKSMGFK